MSGSGLQVNSTSSHPEKTTVICAETFGNFHSSSGLILKADSMH